ncbi:hypothetical protein ACYSNW_11765 [Enterococcus sp. LJL99]
MIYVVTVAFTPPFVQLLRNKVDEPKGNITFVLSFVTKQTVMQK